MLTELIATFSMGSILSCRVESAAHSPKLATDRISVVEFLQRLAQCDEYPRVRDAIISLLLLHPELADAVEQALRESTAEVAERIAIPTLATLYLQRLWSVRLTIALGRQSMFPGAAIRVPVGKKTPAFSGLPLWYLRAYRA